jgi:hypothetical protein
MLSCRAEFKNFGTAVIKSEVMQLDTYLINEVEVVKEGQVFVERPRYLRMVSGAVSQVAGGVFVGTKLTGRWSRR